MIQLLVFFWDESLPLWTVIREPMLTPYWTSSVCGASLCFRVPIFQQSCYLACEKGKRDRTLLKNILSLTHASVMAFTRQKKITFIDMCSWKKNECLRPLTLKKAFFEMWKRTRVKIT